MTSSMDGRALWMIALNYTSITLYHVNQRNDNGITNMNLGAAAGDALFDLRRPIQYFDCINLQHNRSHYPRQCDNPEEFAVDLVISKIKILWDRSPGEYSRCNLCDHGSTPFAPPPSSSSCGPFHNLSCANTSCVDGEYACWPRNNQVGIEDVRPLMVHPMPPNATWPGHEPRYWESNLANRTGGVWVSTLAGGQCTDDATPWGSGCHWRLLATQKVVSASCHAKQLRRAVEKLDRRCFGALDPENASNVGSLSYLRCYYQALLGEAASHSMVGADSGGLTGTAITQLWIDAFEACPGVRQP